MVDSRSNRERIELSPSLYRLNALYETTAEREARLARPRVHDTRLPDVKRAFHAEAILLRSQCTTSLGGA